MSHITTHHQVVDSLHPFLPSVPQLPSPLVTKSDFCIYEFLYGAFNGFKLMYHHLSLFLPVGIISLISLSLAPLSGEGNGNPLQYSCLENPMDGGAWWAAVHGVAKSRTQLSNFTFTFHFHALEKKMATHSSVLAWRIPGTGEPGGLPSMGSHRVGHDWSDSAAAAAPLSRCLISLSPGPLIQFSAVLQVRVTIPYNAFYLVHSYFHFITSMVVVQSLSPTLYNPVDCCPTRLFYPWNFPGKNTGVSCRFFLQGNPPDPGIKSASPSLAGRFFTALPPGKTTSMVAQYRISHFSEKL